VQGLQIIKDSGQPALFLPLGIALAFMAALANTMVTPLGEPTMFFAQGLLLYWHEAVQPWLVLAFIGNMNWVLRRISLSTLAKLAASPI
jgi:hypothetical protein